MVKSETVSLTPSQHAANHVIGGTDPLINPLLLHAARHEIGGADEMLHWIYPERTPAYDGTPVAATWTTIDISAVIGANIAEVLLQIENSGAANTAYGCRAVGSANTQYNNTDIDTNICATVRSNTSGEIQIYTTNGQHTLVTVLGYMVL